MACVLAGAFPSLGKTGGLVFLFVPPDGHQTARKARNTAAGEHSPPQENIACKLRYEPPQSGVASARSVRIPKSAKKQSRKRGADTERSGMLRQVALTGESPNPCESSCSFWMSPFAAPCRRLAAGSPGHSGSASLARTGECSPKPLAPAHRGGAFSRRAPTASGRSGKKGAKKLNICAGRPIFLLVSTGRLRIMVTIGACRILSIAV